MRFVFKVSLLLAFLSPALAQTPQARELISQNSASSPAGSNRLPAGTRVVMRLVSALNSESGTPGSGIYLQTVFPVVHSSRLLIPAGTFVNGTVKGAKKAGRFKRKASFEFVFERLVFASGTELPIAGVLHSLPGSRDSRVGPDGKLKRTDQIDKIRPPLFTAMVTGGLLGGLSDRTWKGVGVGAGLGTGAVLITRGDALHLPAGSDVEMVLTTAVEIPPEALSKEVISILPVATPIPEEKVEDVAHASERMKRIEPRVLGPLRLIER